MAKKIGAPDYNPDREGHRTKKFIIHRATKREMDHVPNMPDLKFNREGRLLLNDEGLAREIQKETRDVSVTRVDYPAQHERGHKYFFGQWPEMPWKRKEAENVESN